MKGVFKGNIESSEESFEEDRVKCECELDQDVGCEERVLAGQGYWGVEGKGKWCWVYGCKAD